MSGKDLKLSRQADLNKKRGRPLRLLKNPLTSNGRGDSSRREIEPKLTPEVFRTPATAVKIRTRKKRGVRPPFVQQADNLVARHSPQQRVGVDTGQPSMKALPRCQVHLAQLINKQHRHHRHHRHREILYL